MSWPKRIQRGPDANGVFSVHKCSLNDDGTVTVSEEIFKREEKEVIIPTRLASRLSTASQPPKYQARGSRADQDVIISIEEKPIILHLTSESVQKQKLATVVSSASLESTHVRCSNCGGLHYTYMCPRREEFRRDKVESKGGVYVPIYKRENIEKKTYSLKLDPVPQSWTRDNILELLNRLRLEVEELLNAESEGANMKKDTSVPWHVRVGAKRGSAGNESQATTPTPAPESEKVRKLRAALVGLHAERCTFPNRDPKRTNFAYLNLGTEEAQILFKTRYDNSRLTGEQTIMHVLLPDEYGGRR
ncbi:Eukaryotic translation initiation factor 3 subunit G [Giardia muris]|uniref:Eukaryotic translation initiation factor 3 subunit G n=1 Tax=Giardia muris TaxID=5742 RepID=A0A4Z1SVY0_GIAMU|nr:Eukaryotic translation initiation factor 3 subunit G [Giardia muris]|eukprot:TNJ29770.1 Eukaryotic translation initiation factor 3 subunit G [Giardia muris]